MEDEGPESAKERSGQGSCLCVEQSTEPGEVTLVRSSSPSWGLEMQKERRHRYCANREVVLAAVEEVQTGRRPAQRWVLLEQDKTKRPFPLM